MGGLGTADRGGQTARQDGTEGSAADPLGHLLASPERRQMAQRPDRTRPIVASGAVVHPLGRAGRVGAPARTGPAMRCRARHDLSRWHHHSRARQSGRRAKKGVDSKERDQREALGRSRGGYGTKACVMADGRGRAIAFALAPGQAHELPLAPGLLDCLPDVPEWIVGDKGLASDAFRARIWEMGARPAIPPKRNDAPVACRSWIYCNRHMVENRNPPPRAAFR